MEEDQLSHNNIKKNLYIISYEKNFSFIICFKFNNHAFGAGSDSSSDTSETALYDQAVKLVKRAGKLEKKDKGEKAKKLYSQAFKKLDKAYKSDKKNPDILNYMGFTSRKTW